ncbi:hypothetical protein [Vibrio alfacsensis]|uniref:hypothetical protein n=1 Tax=Vibrio alfacsensis TaxID=1074311 RepID=UPI0040684B17
MTKRYWIFGALSAGLLGAYWQSNESHLTSAAHTVQSADKTVTTAQYGKRSSLVEVKQALTASSLEKSNSLAIEHAFDDVADRARLADHNDPTVTDNTAMSLTQTYGEPRPNADTTDNGKPIINLSVEQQLQTIIYAWELSQNSPINYSLSLDQLFEDPEGDLLTTRIWLESANGLNVLNQGQVMVQGAPKQSETITYLAASARDDYHGEDDHAWVTTRFELPAVLDEKNNTEHPLIGDVVYRLETTQLLGGVAYTYEVVYCEAFQFIEGEVFYAAANNRRTCPENTALTKVGSYQISDDSLIVSANGSRQIWTTKKIYPSQVHKGTDNYFTTVYNGNQFESYTLQKNKRAMETRLNVTTGEHKFQMVMFDYLFPITGKGYVLGVAGNYIYDYSALGESEFEGMDSDLNMKIETQDLYCDNLHQFWYSSILAGPGEFTDIISSSNDPFNPDIPLHCGEWYDPNWQRTYTYFGLEYQDYDIFQEGEVYSYVLKPHPQFADRVEEFKINLIYHRPKSAE